MLSVCCKPSPTAVLSNCVLVCIFPAFVSAADEAEDGDVVIEDDIGKSRDGSRTDDETVERY